jgi:Leucine zipper with capping helix domain
MISEAEIEGSKKAVLRYVAEWRKRKRACMDIIDTICESADFNRKDFIKKLGIDTDEDCKVNVNDYLTV